MNRPYVICLMMTTVDGKIYVKEWGNDPQVKKLAESFEQIHEEIGIKAWICGRTTIDRDFTKGTKPIYKKGNHDISRTDFIAKQDATSFAIAVDKDGKIGWEKNDLYGDHVITILSENVKDSYLAHLQDIGVSYLFAGKKDIDLPLVLEKLYNLFGIEKLMLEGGGHLNGSFLNEGLVDELNLLLLPLADGIAEAPTLFDVNPKNHKGKATLLKLENIKKLDDDIVWLKYTINNN